MQDTQLNRILLGGLFACIGLALIGSATVWDKYVLKLHIWIGETFHPKTWSGEISRRWWAAGRVLVSLFGLFWLVYGILILLKKVG